MHMCLRRSPIITSFQDVYGRLLVARRECGWDERYDANKDVIRKLLGTVVSSLPSQCGPSVAISGDLSLFFLVITLIIVCIELSAMRRAPNARDAEYERDQDRRQQRAAICAQYDD